MKGFVFFDFAVWPAHWAKTPILRRVPVRNVPEVYHQLRLGIRCIVGHWEREIPLETPFCTQHRREDNSEVFDRCVAHTSTQVKEPYYDYPDISLDLGTTASIDYDLVILNSKRYISLATLLERTYSVRHSTVQLKPDVFKIIPPVHMHGPVTVKQAAQRLAWQVEHHLNIGFTGVIMYVYPGHALLLEAEPALQDFLRSGKATLVSWDVLSIYEGMGFFDQQVALAHGLLSFWGRWCYVFPADLDEFLIPATPGDTLPDMLSSGCLSLHPECSILSGHAVFPHELDPPNMIEPDLWAHAGPLPLQYYQYSSGGGGMVKPLMDPNRVFPACIHATNVCTGTGHVADGTSMGKLSSPCSKRRACDAVPNTCAWIAHVINMHRVRAKPENATVVPSNWLWMYTKPEPVA
ncbi:MAG: hypothetical protein J3K34DRAFT_450218 [Monoraphidium minutum]|nr:MAG: hypothetical protein J3K34DRAFT_450218 [Monoraphidium minutum]